MKKILMLLTAMVSFSFADALDEGNASYEQRRYLDAMSSFAKACENGNAKACFKLGAMYENGEGTAQNKYQASVFYAQACRGNESLGCSRMGLSYDTP